MPQHVHPRIQQRHPFLSLVAGRRPPPYPLLLKHARLIVDTRERLACANCGMVTNMLKTELEARR